MTCGFSSGRGGAGNTFGNIRGNTERRVDRDPGAPVGVGVPGFRARPQVRNVLRWYELYIVTFIVLSVVVLWLIAALLLLPAMM